MGPVFPPAPRSPALVPDDLGDRRTRGSFPTASFDPCGSSSTSSAARWSVRTGFHRLVPVLASGPVRRLVLVSSASRLVHSLPPGGSVTATPPCRSGPSVPLWPKPPPSFRPFRPLVKRPADCEPFAASAVRQIPTEVFLRRVFQHCCGHRCQTKTFSFSLVISAVSRWNFKFGITVSMT